MENLEIPETKLTPKIRFDYSSGTLEIKGMSIPENSSDFYKPLKDAIDRYSADPKPVTTLNFSLVHFNTSSSKQLLHIITAFAALDKRGSTIKVNWYYNIDDEDLLETSKDLEEVSGLEFNFIGLEDED